ncbi:hypothetical protein A4X13_0g3391 [Tilletia indica]|uniref:Uncharacterized protein n=1 Tax=Tilletia indica TaxID=43049 RepID=A0A177TJB0_9BASI|nr:hypothetical protein A4X13_0g3391 [Tilletia indica]
MASTSAPLTENNLRSLASSAPTGHTVLDFVAGQAALVPASSHPNKEAVQADTVQNTAAERGTGCRRPQSPMLEARIATKRKAVPNREESVDEQRSEGSQLLKIRSTKKRAHSEKEVDREKREVEERLKQRKERRRAKALIVRDSSTTAAHKIRQKNSQKKSKQRAESVSTSASSSEDDEDEESDDSDKGKKKQKKKKKLGKEEGNSLKSARKRNLADLAAMELLDKPKSITKERRITLAPKTGVFNKGVASRKSKVPTSDLVLSELKFFNQPAQRTNDEDSAIEDEDEVHEQTETASAHSAYSNRIRHSREAGSSRFFKAPPSRPSPIQSESETEGDDAEVYTRRQDRTAPNSAEVNLNTDRQAEQNDPCRVDAGVQVLTHTPPLHHNHAPELASPAQVRSSSWHAPDISSSNELSTALPGHSYITDLCPTQPANSWRREHHLARPERLRSNQIQPRLYASQSSHQAPHFRGDVLEPSRNPSLSRVAQSFPPSIYHPLLGQTLGSFPTPACEVEVDQGAGQWNYPEHQASPPRNAHEWQQGSYQSYNDFPPECLDTECRDTRGHYAQHPIATFDAYPSESQQRNVSADYPQSVAPSYNFAAREEPLREHQPDIFGEPDQMQGRSAIPEACVPAAFQTDEQCYSVHGEERLPSWRMAYDEDSNEPQTSSEHRFPSISTEHVSGVGHERPPRAVEDILGVKASQLESFWEPFRT